MDFDEFQDLARPRKKIVAGPLSFWSNGLAGEMAEVAEEYKLLIDMQVKVGGIANLCKKLDRDDPDCDPALAEWRAGIVSRVQTELGDLQFYERQLHDRLGLSMNDTAESCIAKLAVMDAIGQKGA